LAIGLSDGVADDADDAEPDRFSFQSTDSSPHLWAITRTNYDTNDRTHVAAHNNADFTTYNVPL
jgi:hypothetical protein